MSLSQVWFSLRPIQGLKHLGLPQPLPTPPTNSSTIFLPTFTGKESASLEYLIDIIFKTEFHQIYPVHYQPKNSELAVHPWIRA